MQEVINCNLNAKTDWIDIVNLGIALINVIAVILFFIIEKKKQKQEKINDYKLSWYKLIDIPFGCKIYCLDINIFSHIYWI